MLCHDGLFHVERHFLLEQDGHLHFYSLHLGLVDRLLNIFHTISVCGHCHLPDHLIGNTPFYLHLNWSISLDNPLHDSLYLHYLDLFLYLYDYFFDDYLDRPVNLLDDDVGHLNFNYLQDGLFDHDYFFYDSGHLDYLLDDARDHYYFLYNFLNFDNSWHLNDLLNDMLHDLRLNFDNLFLNDDRDWLLNMNGLDDLFFDWN